MPTMRNVLENLNKLALQRSRDYFELEVCGKRIITPYYINNIQHGFESLMKESGIEDEFISQTFQKYKNRQIPFGWYRGKGTPDEIKESAVAISNMVGLPLYGATSYGISEFMKLYGLGIDCSGFVYNVLKYAFTECSNEELFSSSLDWREEGKTGVNYAGVFVFAGKASERMDPDKVQPLDLVFIKGIDKQYSHMGILLLEGSKLKLFQSSLVTDPVGVTATDYSFSGGQPVFGFAPTIGSRWDELYKKGKVEFRRLRCICCTSGCNICSK